MDVRLIREMQVLLREKLLSIIVSLENGSMNNTLWCKIEVLFEMINQLHEIVSSMDSSENFNVLMEISKLDEATNSFKEGLQYFQDEILLKDIDVENKPSLFHTGQRGRPGYYIPQELLEQLLECDFGPVAIARLLNVNISVIKRNLQKYGLSGVVYSDITDIELNEIVQTLKESYPDAGYRTISSLLREKGHRVQRARVQDSLRAVDPDGVLFRRLFFSVRRVTRRTYNVRAPRALWHIDGNHKLIRWRFVIHGGIDGYSKLPVFLKVNTNNKAISVLEAFVTAVNEWGIPEKVRSDKGGENTEVARFMLENKGIGSFISGRSVHNQRIERLWREIWNGCISLYYQLFHHMEDGNILNIDNESHILGLHLVFQEKIQRHLDQLRDALIRRPIRTSNYKTPLQLWIEGQMFDPVVNLSEDQLTLYGIDYEGPVSTECEMVQIPETHQPPGHLLTVINGIIGSPSTNFGIDNFLQVVDVLNSD